MMTQQQRQQQEKRSEGVRKMMGVSLTRQSRSVWVSLALWLQLRGSLAHPLTQPITHSLPFARCVSMFSWSREILLSFLSFSDQRAAAFLDSSLQKWGRDESLGMARERKDVFRGEREMQENREEEEESHGDCGTLGVFT